jgi:tRNA(Arg) A34 adenosine deaminase TadA
MSLVPFYSSSYYSRSVTDPYYDYTYSALRNLSKNDNSFLSVAAKLALTSDNRFRIGAIIVKSGRVLGGSANITKTSPSTPPNRFSTHAEIAALRVASETEDSTLYISRLTTTDQLATARPCSWCMQKILEAGIYRVVYTIGPYTSECFYTSTVEWSSNAAN